MISEGNLYKYDQKALQFTPRGDSSGGKWKQFARFFTFISFFALILMVIIHYMVGSPNQLFLKHKTSLYKNRFVLLNENLDSLNSKLHSEIFPSDKYYREILDLDSVPTPVRFAGTGGSNPYDTLKNYHYKDIITNTLRKINILNNQLKIQDQSYEYVLKKAIFNSEKTFAAPAIQPVKPTENIHISSYFGYRKDPFTKKTKMHSGLDFAGPKNTKIYATADGIVTITKDSRRGYGKEVVISHAFDLSTRYAHLNDILVSKGQKVKRGELIGLMGNTGKSTGVHLHYEVRIDGRPTNPIYYFADDLTEKEYELITKLTHEEGN